MDGITDSMAINLGKLQMVRDREAWHASVHWGFLELDTTWSLKSNAASVPPGVTLSASGPKL